MRTGGPGSVAKTCLVLQMNEMNIGQLYIARAFALHSVVSLMFGRKDELVASGCAFGNFKEIRIHISVLRTTFLVTFTAHVLVRTRLFVDAIRH
jgi:hypothetical protein